MEKKFTREMVQQLRDELNEAVADVAKKHGISIHFGNAKFDDLSIKYTVDLEFEATADFDPAKKLWEKHCSRYGLEPEDFGKEFKFLGENQVYRIIGCVPTAQKNVILIQRVPDGKEFVATAYEVRTCLGKMVTEKVPSPAEQSGSDFDPKKMEWELHCWRWNLPKEYFGKTHQINGVFYKISGCKPNARKNAILIQRVSDGKEYVISPETAKNSLTNG